MTQTTLAPHATTPHATTLHAPTLRDIAPLFRGRRSVLGWSDRPVPDSLVEEVYDAVRWGPTALNASPLRLLLVHTPDARERLVTHLNDGNKDRVRQAPLVLVVAADTAFHERMDTLMPHLPGIGAQLAASPKRESLAREQSWLQAGYLITGLRAAGLDVGPMSGMDAAGIDDDLLAGTSWRSLMVLNLGFPAHVEAAHPRAPRLSADEVTRVA